MAKQFASAAKADEAEPLPVKTEVIASPVTKAGVPKRLYLCSARDGDCQPAEVLAVDSSEAIALYRVARGVPVDSTMTVTVVEKK